MSLKELTKEQHTNAERQEFVKIMFSGKINPELYATYLYNQFPQYEILEMFAMRAGLTKEFPEIERAKKIYADFLELWPHKDKTPQVCPVVEEYVMYMKEISNDPDRLMAHLYVRHMGDLSGGQMIAKRVPGEGRYYQFDGELEDIKNKIRTKLADSMADEAKICFEYATRMFKEMMDFVKFVDEDEKESIE